ncbi:hypothetical protein [Streptomyces galbus]
MRRCARRTASSASRSPRRRQGSAAGGLGRARERGVRGGVAARLDGDDRQQPGAQRGRSAGAELGGGAGQLAGVLGVVGAGPCGGDVVGADDARGQFGVPGRLGGLDQFPPVLARLCEAVGAGDREVAQQPGGGVQAGP